MGLSLDLLVANHIWVADHDKKSSYSFLNWHFKVVEIILINKHWGTTSDNKLDGYTNHRFCNHCNTLKIIQYIHQRCCMIVCDDWTIGSKLERDSTHKNLRGLIWWPMSTMVKSLMTTYSSFLVYYYQYLCTREYWLTLD